MMLLTPFISLAQLEIPDGYALVTKSPSNGKKIEQVFLDFDNDGLEDTAVLVENILEFSDYKFILYISSLKKTYQVDLINLQEMSVYPIQIKTRNDVVEFGYYEEGTGAFGRFIKLRFNSKINRVQVIGYDVIYRSMPNIHITKSYNLITGKFIIKKTIYDGNGNDNIEEFLGENDVFKNAVFIEHLDAEMIEKLDEVGSNFEKSKKKDQIAKFNLGEDISEMSFYVKDIYRKDNLICVDLDIVQIKYTEEDDKIILNENSKIRTYIIDDTTIIYTPKNCEGVTPEKLTEIKKSVLDDKTIIVVGGSKDGVLESINFGCYE
ncbi:hypothetical protein N9W61_03620 [Algibacter sp.]|nr:hypothetical protein [Algibacter sp.]